MNNQQRSLINCSNTIIKQWIVLGGKNTVELTINYSSIIINLWVVSFKFSFLEQLKSITDKSNINWEIYIQDSFLKLKIWK